MLIVRHLGTPNSSFLLASLDVIECVIQYYTDQCATGQLALKPSALADLMIKMPFEQMRFHCFKALI